jgi:hypothetical protein
VFRVHARFLGLPLTRVLSDAIGSGRPQQSKPIIDGTLAPVFTPLRPRSMLAQSAHIFLDVNARECDDSSSFVLHARKP